MIPTGSIAFLQPLLLTALIALPAIWWLLRATPPRPKRVYFPPTRLMEDLQNKQQTPSRTPWWLTLLRILVAALVIAALASPVINPQRTTSLSEGPIVLVVDNGWASAKNWQDKQRYMDTLFRRAISESRSMAVVVTANDGRKQTVALEAASKIKERAASIKPLPFAPDRLASLENFKKELGDIDAPSIFWLTDGIDHGNAKQFAEELEKIAGSDGDFTVVKPNPTNSPHAVIALPHASNDLKAKVLRAHSGTDEGLVVALSARNERLAEAAFSFSADARETEANFVLPLELRNQVARLEIQTEQTAGSVFLLDGRSQRQRVGLISGEASESAQPLLSPLYYIDKALSPYSDIVTPKDSNLAEGTKTILSQTPSTLVLADIGRLVGETYEMIDEWVNKGGVLVRFAGPRMEKDADRLLPVVLRKGGRTLGGALSWSTPQGLAPFEETSIFRGLKISPDVRVNRQVLADPSQIRPETEVWARLQDGTPLVTAAKQGDGWLVLFHITANSDWSKLPHSGLFVQMLRRVTELSNYTVSITDTSQEEADTSADTDKLASTKDLNFCPRCKR